MSHHRPVPVAALDLEPLREELVAAQALLDGMMLVANDATSAAPVYVTQEAQRADIERSAAELRASLQISVAKIDSIAALIRLHAERRGVR